MAHIIGTAGNDTLTGTTSADWIEGLAGNDTLYGLAGNDILDGGPGADKMYGGAGNDTYVVDSAGDAAVEASIALVSTAADGSQGNAGSAYRFGPGPAISADGRYVAFVSGATNLVAGDTNDYPDVFVKHLQTGEITRVSTAADGTQGNGWNGDSSISADGRYVAFLSEATNLVAGDANGTGGVFVKDLQTGTIVRASTAADGTQANGGLIRSISISADGRYVAFTSNATNLVAGDTNSCPDVFVKDLQTGTIVRASTAADGTQANSGLHDASSAISADGRYVAFDSIATNLVAGDTNSCQDVFVKDLQTGEITRASAAADGTQGGSGGASPSISADGHYVAFGSGSWNLVADDTNGSYDEFVKDLRTGAITRVSTAADGTQGNNGSSGGGSISGDGRYVAFESYASNLVAGDTNGKYDVFLKDLQTGAITRLSTAADSTQGDADSFHPAIAADGGSVAFDSEASNLVAGDSNVSARRVHLDARRSVL